MLPQIRLGLLPILLLAVVALSTVRCECDPSNNDECLAAEQCEGIEPWRSSECTVDEGHWECIGRKCVSICPECRQDPDCLGQEWDGPCAQIDGHWECREGTCLAVCDGAECIDATDCADEVWPGDVGCDEADGHWECDQQACEAVCDAPQCSQASDCDSETWPGDAGCAQDAGHWECSDGDCSAVCDPVGCTSAADCTGETWPGDENCFEADGHWECNQQECQSVCDVECSDETHCQANEWPSASLDCSEADGYWSCDNGTCQADCNGDECSEVGQCDQLGWTGENGCGGFWTCTHGYCSATCDDVGCGDDTCADEAGETVVSCPDDCAECSLDADCLGEAWDLVCAGRWECQNSACVAVCDYTTCGDGTCDAAAGEDEATCRPDCQGTCSSPVDCLGENWGDICQGSWTCGLLDGVCQENCSAPQCGNGTCQPELGEGDRCPDCSAQLCSEDSDCSDYDLPAGCTGYWTCAWVVCLPICE